MSSILDFLRGCVEEETQVLLDTELRVQGRKRSSKKLEAQCREEAREHYVEEVAEIIRSGWMPSPWAVISYRRKPKAWAVAGAIKQRIEREEDA
jgi:hypothetical protein